jgi:hypothetical protein
MSRRGKFSVAVASALGTDATVRYPKAGLTVFFGEGRAYFVRIARPEVRDDLCG